ncbi:hypothetical protein [Vibrio gangliei]|uniref:hypothetical protein n=1 Tax=Vibrio gangliei TaxID=2077090 RepID=UPI000D01F5EF|nr:hypothetical protein [Vibrio gangliei]
MTDSIHLTTYHDAVIDWLKTNVDWLQTVQYYPEVQTELPAPCAFFAVEEWDLSEEQPMNGMLAVDLNCKIMVVFGLLNEDYQIEVRNAAMAICSAINEQRFGLPIEPLVLQGAEPDSFQPELDDYAVWSIRYIQTIEVGTDVYKPEGITPSTVFVGYAPDIGAKNEDKYEQVVPDEGV